MLYDMQIDYSTNCIYEKKKEVSNNDKISQKKWCGRYHFNAILEYNAESNLNLVIILPLKIMGGK